MAVIIVSIVMKRTFVLLLSCLALAAAAGQAETPATGRRTAYLLQMGLGLDQFLANHLVTTGVFDVVTDPKLADVVFTDSIGKSFEARMAQMYPAEVQPAAKKEADKEAGDKEPAGDAVSMKAPPVGLMSSFGRGKGNIFVVDTSTAQVIWSTYAKPEGPDPKELDRTAERIVAKLKKDMLKSPKSGKAAPKPPAEAVPAAPVTAPAPPPTTPAVPPKK